MESKENYTEQLVKLISKKMGINIDKYDIDEIKKGMVIELEHGSKNQFTNITNDDPVETLKIVLAHLNELSDYYTRLEKMEKENYKLKSYNKKTVEENYNILNNSTILRFKELCGIVENSNKKQLKNSLYNGKYIIKEEINKNDFDIINFENDDIGLKKSEEEKRLYKMKNKENY